MSFIWPAMLALLLLLPLCVVLYVRMRRRRDALAAHYGSLGLVQGAGRPLGARRHVPPALFLVGLAILIVGLARPQAAVSLPRIAGTVMLTFDVSGSMAAEDMEPTRMEAAKALAREFVAAQPPGVRIGVTAFSEGGLTVQAPTDDKDAVLDAIGRISPQRGTSLGQGILAALAAIAVEAGETPQPTGSDAPTPTPVAPGEIAPALIVLFSDGENTAPPDPLEAALAAADRGVRIHTVGIGTTSGIPLEVEGFTVHTRLDEATLQQIADMTGGAYYGAERQHELDTIYQDLARQLVVTPEETEITALFAGAGILVLLAGALCSLLWFGRVA